MVIRFTIDPVLNKVFNTFLNLEGNIMSKVENTGVEVKYLNRLNELSIKREGFERNTLKGSNRELYEILSSIYEIYNEMKTKKSKVDEDFLKTGLKEMNIKFQRNSPLLTILIRYVFNSDRTRSYNYNRVISSAHQREISPGKLSEFIEEQGGIEECKKKFVRSNKSLEKEEKKNTEINNVLEYIDSFESLSTINLGNTKLKIENDCKLIITVGRLSSDQKSVELIKILDPINKPLENKVLKLISSDLNFELNKYKIQTEQTLEKVSG